MRKENLTGKIFTRLTVLYPDQLRSGSFWICKCICGNIKSVNSGNLKSGGVKSCGCYLIDRTIESSKARIQDLTGKIFNRLTVIGRDLSKNRIYWFCRCSCDNKIVSVRRDGLKSGDVQSCGCLNREITSKLCKELSFKHGLSHTKSYNAWTSIKQRCYNKDCNEYKNYGARGIILAEYWIDDVVNFCDYVSKLENYDIKTSSIDRIDNNGNYEIGNLRWASKSQQSQNSRLAKLNWNKVKMIRILCKSIPLSKLSEMFKVTISTINAVIKYKTWKEEC